MTEFSTQSFGPQIAQGSMQAPFDAAVVVPTVLRPSLLRAVRSIFSQEWPGRIQILIGVDVRQGDADIIRQLCGECPDRMAITVLDPGYSTAKIHGGIYNNAYSGSLRTALSYLANSARVAYLDDDNWWAPQHLSDMMTAIEGFDWAYSYRWFVDPGTQEVMCADDFESVGPNKGIYRERLGGFVDSNCLMIDKTKCHSVMTQWSIPLLPDGTGEDRNVFNALRNAHSVGWTRRPSVYYVLNPNATAQPARDKIFADRGLKMTVPQQAEPAMYAHRDLRINEYLLASLTRKLHLGAGPNLLDGWLNTDISPQNNRVIALDVNSPLPFEGDTFNYVFSEHMIEHLTLPQAVRLLAEIFRILKPGGVVRIATPDLLRLLALYTNEPADIQKRYVDWTMENFVGNLRGYNPTLVLNNMYYSWGHRFIYDQNLLGTFIANAGFTDLKRTPNNTSEHPDLNNINLHGHGSGAADMADYETMTIEARKPDA